jgi:predicted nucleic acid-binding protein
VVGQFPSSRSNRNRNGTLLHASYCAVRAGDAIHTATALETGETEIWTNDRHLLAAVAHFGLAGRSA